MLSKYKTIERFPNYIACEEGYLINKKTGNVLRGHKKKTGYKEVCLRNEDGKHTFLLHRIIASAFCDDKRGDEVNHIDGDKHNNQASNLEWVNHGENLKHAFENGLRNDDVSPRSVIATDILTKERRRFSSIYRAARELKASQGNICMACQGKRPHASGYYWEYERG